MASPEDCACKERRCWCERKKVRRSDPEGRACYFMNAWTGPDDRGRGWARKLTGVSRGSRTVARREPTGRGSVLQAGRRFKGRCRSWLLNTVSGADCQVLFEKDSWPGGAATTRGSPAKGPAECRARLLGSPCATQQGDSLNASRCQPSLFHSTATVARTVAGSASVTAPALFQRCHRSTIRSRAPGVHEGLASLPPPHPRQLQACIGALPTSR